MRIMTQRQRRSGMNWGQVGRTLTIRNLEAAIRLTFYLLGSSVRDGVGRQLHRFGLKTVKLNRISQNDLFSASWSPVLSSNSLPVFPLAMQVLTLTRW